MSPSRPGDLRRLLVLMLPEWHWALAGILLSAAVILANAGLLALSGWFIAAMALAGHGGPTIEYFTPAAAIRALALLRAFGRYAERLVTHDTTFRVLTRLRVWFYEQLEPLAPAGLQYHRGGDILARLRTDIDRLETMYLRVLVPSAAALLAVPVILLFLLSIFPGAAALDLAGLSAAGIAIPVLAQRLGRRPGNLAAQHRGQQAAELTEQLRGYTELLVDGALPATFIRGAEIETELRRAQLAQGWISWSANAAAQLAAQLALWGSLLMAMPATAAGHLTGPDVAMLALAIAASYEAVGGLPAAYQALGETMAAARRIFELADTQPPVTDPTLPNLAPAGYSLVAEHITLRYAANLPPILDNLSFCVPEGGCLGITGSSGAGKTSLLNLVLRFWAYEAGSLRLGEAEISSMPGETMRGLCAVVAQHTHLFNTSIRENLLIARPDATEAQLLDALHDAALLDEILSLPEGIDTPVGEAGASLSGGQARRLAIARAFLKDAPLLLLDEPTEGLDTQTEQRVLEALARLRQGRTTLLVSHRSGPLRLADQILRLNPI